MFRSPVFRCGVLILGPLLMLAGAGLAAEREIEPPAEPARIKLSINPQRVAPGAEAELQVELEPIEGVRINRYPQIKVRVGAQEGVVEESQLLHGDSTPPPPDELEHNYFERLDPLRLALKTVPGAPAGRHQLDAEVTYAYCIKGLCSRVRVPVKVPLEVGAP